MLIRLPVKSCWSLEWQMCIRYVWIMLLPHFSIVLNFHKLSLILSKLWFSWLKSFELYWNSKVPPRVAFFSWSTSLGKILTTDNLRKRHVLVLDWCYMCKNCGELVEHLLLHCPIACELWSLVFCLFGIHWFMPQKVIELFESWQGRFRRHRNIDLWRIVPHCLLWCIWCERNARSFEGCERSMLEIKSLFLHTLLDWSVVFCHFSCSSLPVLLDRCNLGF